MMWDERYDEAGFGYGTEPNDFLRVNVDAIPAGPVLCLADGEGRNGVFLARSGYAVTTVDSSVIGVQKARRLAQQSGVSVDARVGDLATYDLGRGWAGIVSIFCHLPPPLRAKVHRDLVRALAPGGVLLLEAYTPRQLGRGTGGPPVEAMLYEPEVVRSELKGLEIEHLAEVVRPVVEGRFHTGLASVVQVVARRPSA